MKGLSTTRRRLHKRRVLGRHSINRAVQLATNHQLVVGAQRRSGTSPELPTDSSTFLRTSVARCCNDRPCRPPALRICHRLQITCAIASLQARSRLEWLRRFPMRPSLPSKTLTTQMAMASLVEHIVSSRSKPQRVLSVWGASAGRRRLQQCSRFLVTPRARKWV